MGLRPDIRLRANDNDISEVINERLISLNYTDELGNKSDLLELNLSDADDGKQIEMPPSGAELSLSLGYDGQLTNAGLFVVDEIELNGWPSTITIRARAAIFSKSKKGKAVLHSQKTRSWDASLPISDIIKTIASEHSLSPSIAADLYSVTVGQQNQTNESDISFLSRLLSPLGYVVKPFNGSLVALKEGDTAKFSGGQVPAVEINATDISDYSASFVAKKAPGTVTAFYYDFLKANKFSVAVGDGEPATELKINYNLKKDALMAATAEHEKRKRKGATVNLTMPGNPALVAGGAARLLGFRRGINGDWFVQSARHDVGVDGYMTDLSLTQK